MISNIHFGNKNKSYIGLVDSGSDVSLIDWSVFENIPSKNILKIWKSRPTKLNSASGHGIKSLGKATISMQIKGEHYKVNFILTKGFKFDVLLGSDFIYEHNATIDFQKNVMIINKKVIILRCKSELPLCNLLEASRSQIIEPYTVTHIEVKSRDRSYGKGHGTYMITPLSNTSLFEDQPGLVSPCVTVNKQTTGRYLLPIVNNTGKIFNVKNRTVIAFIEHLHRTDLVEPYTPNSTHTSTVNAKNRQHFHTNTISNHNVAKINNKDKLGCSDKEYNIGNEIDIVKYNFLVYTLNKHRKLFVDDIRNLKQTNILQATFNTGHSQPIKQRPYKNPLALQSNIDKQINDMLDAGIVSPSSSPWSSPMVIVPKRDGTHRICIYYRKLNKALVKDSYPLPRIEDIFATLGKSKFFSTLDLKSGYHQISIAPEDREKTAFCTRTSLFEFNCMPFGIASAPAIF